MQDESRPQLSAAVGAMQFPLHRWQSSFKFEPDPSGQGGGGASPPPPAAGSGEGGGSPPPVPDVIPRVEAKRAFDARDAAKKAERRATALATAIAGKLGIDLSELEVVETGNAENPFEIKGEALDKVGETLTAAQQAKIDGQKRAGKWEEREKELTDTLLKKQQKAVSDTEQKAKAEVTAASRRATALERWIDETAGDAPIREALAAEKAVHDGTGNYDELVTLIKPRVKREIAIDEETGKASVKFTPLSEDGTPLTDTKGATKSVRDLVAEWLAKRPHLKQSPVRGGPGAGGRSVGGAAPGGAVITPSERGKSLGAKMFGVRS